MMVMVMECCEEEPPAAPGYVRQPLEGMEVFHLFDGAERRIEEEIRMAISGVYSEKRMYWERAGWLQEVLALVENTADSQAVKPVSFFRSSPTGAVIRVCTLKANSFVKSSLGSRNDTTFGEAPEYCAMPIHVDEENRAMIMRDYGESVMADRVVKADLRHTLMLVQPSTIGKMEHLVATGFIDARPEALLGRFDEVMKHPELCMLEEFCQDHPEEYDGYEFLLKRLALFRKHASELREEVKEASEKAVKLPATVLHNDIGMRNTCRDTKTGKVKVIDWDLGCIGRLFMDRPCFPSAICEYWKGNCTEAEIEDCCEQLRLSCATIDLLKVLNLRAEIENYQKSRFLISASIALCNLTCEKDRSTVHSRSDSSEISNFYISS